MQEILNKVKELEDAVESYKVSTLEELEAYRIEFIGSKGKVKDLFGLMREVANEEKKNFGLKVNAVKQAAEAKYNELKDELEQVTASTGPAIDMTKPADPIKLGSRHPISIVRNQIIEIFARIGYTVSEGPEIEDDWHNFSALHFPPDHPARDMQDTYFVQTDPDIVLRTHTSSVQVRVMENTQPPIRTISPGRVFRNETISARSHAFFHQVEGLYVDKGVSFADLKQTLYYFAQEMFGKDSEIKLRPSYFPFTEPSAEMDVTCFICNGDGCPVCKHTGWVEIMGCGMVDPAVLDNCGIDSSVYTGFAFGMGIDRITMLKYGINDIRVMSENDVRFLDQFKAAF